MIEIKLSKDKKGWYLQSHRRLEEMYSHTTTCFYCNKDVVLYNVSETPKGGLLSNSASVDHVYAKKDARRKFHKNKNIPSPVVMSCHSCNQSRGDYPFEAYCLKVGIEKPENHGIFFIQKERVWETKE